MMFIVNQQIWWCKSLQSCVLTSLTVFIVDQLCQTGYCTAISAIIWANAISLIMPHLSLR